MPNSTQTTLPATEKSGTSQNRRVTDLAKRVDLRKGGLLGALVLLIIIFTALHPSFFSIDNAINILVGASVIAIIAMGQAFVIGTSGIDLSVGSTAALSGIVAALAMQTGMPVALALLAGVLTGALAGALNGIIVTAAGITPFMVTLGTLSIYSGLALVISDGRPIYNLPLSFNDAMNSRFIGIPVSVWTMVVVGVVLGILLRNFTIGEYALSMGGNEEATRLAGINITAYKIAIYALSGTTAAIAGLVIVGRLGTADPTSGTDILLPAIAAAVMGGASLLGGEASVFGAIVGAVVITALQTGLTLLGVTTFIQIIVVGIVIVVAVGADRLAEGRVR
jgi:ribose transport system permease protein